MLLVHVMNSLSVISDFLPPFSNLKSPLEKMIMYSCRGTICGLLALFQLPHAVCLAALCLFHITVPLYNIFRFTNCFIKALYVGYVIFCLLFSPIFIQSLPPLINTLLVSFQISFIQFKYFS